MEKKIYKPYKTFHVQQKLIKLQLSENDNRSLKENEKSTKISVKEMNYEFYCRPVHTSYYIQSIAKIRSTKSYPS